MILLPAKYPKILGIMGPCVSYPTLVDYASIRHQKKLLCYLRNDLILVPDAKNFWRIMAERKFRKVEDNFVTLEKEGSSVEGMLLRRDTVSFQGGKSVVGRYTLRGDAGNEFVILGATTLDNKMAGIPDGQYVKITFTGKERTGSGQNVKLYLVEVAE